MKAVQRSTHQGRQGDSLPVVICSECYSDDIAVRTRNFKVSFFCRRCGGIRPVKHVYEK